jgi:imidazoleglycerol phosphate synthase glutamine amidotransferase subunit HisH
MLYAILDTKVNTLMSVLNALEHIAVLDLAQEKVSVNSDFKAFNTIEVLVKPGLFTFCKL